MWLMGWMLLEEDGWDGEGLDGVYLLVGAGLLFQRVFRRAFGSLYVGTCTSSGCCYTPPGLSNHTANPTVLYFQAPILTDCSFTTD